MAFNFTGCAQLPLSVFGGKISEIPPPNVPEGASPDCQDVVFSRIGVASRPGLSKVFGTPLSGATVPTVTYGKTFTTPAGDIFNLYLDSNGVLYYENVIASPGTYTQIGTVTPGSLAKSITAFGREYIAISDGLHGTEPPLQWDGTNLDRVTQDGPGAPPTVSTFSLPSVAMASTGSPTIINLIESDPASQIDGDYFSRINCWTTDSVAGIHVGEPFTIAGYSGVSAPMNDTWTVLAIYTGPANSLLVLSAYLPSTTVYSVAAATGTVPASTMRRSGNTVTVTTAVAHRLKIGYQAQITGMTAATVGTSISSIVINNENLPGIATVTTATDHGLIPGVFASIFGVNGAVVGSGITSVTRAGNVVTVVTSGPHGLSPGAVVTLAGVTAASFNTTVVVSQVVSTTVFTFAQADVNGASSGGTVGINWPIPNSPTPAYFQVVSAPTSTSFQVAISYSNGTWASGYVSYAWNGTFFVSDVPSATTFQYQQYGPDATAAIVGAVTPYGQVSPGKHQCQVLFMRRNGAITRPSPPVPFTANGGQFLSVSDIAIGPPDVTARILAFAGAGGAYFFYVPVPAMVDGQQISTATQINDNTTTSAVLDFSDNTLFAGLGISIPGNDLESQKVLDGALGFGLYSSRLVTWGQRNRVDAFLNMGFDGGYSPLAPTVPLGWSPGSGTAVLAAGHITGWGASFDAATPSSMKQSAYQDANGAPIIEPNTLYKIRVWLKPSSKTTGAIFVVNLISVSTSWTAFAGVAATAMNLNGAWHEATMNLVTPAVIPSDMTLQISCSGAASVTTVLVDDLSVIYSANPYEDSSLLGSYVNNPEAFDGVSGKFGASGDSHKVMDVGAIRQTLCLLTKDPGGRLHETVDNGVTEPAGWTVNQVAANCGLLSAFALATSQADDATASGGEEWLAWASAGGARIFGGGSPEKISQEIQPDWVGAANAGAGAWSSAPGISPTYQTMTWALNDPATRTLYFGLPLAVTAAQGAANIIWAMNYRGLETASQIAGAAPGIGRKWAPWSIKANGAALMSRAAGSLSVVLFGGNGKAPGAAAGYGNVYTLSAAKLTDDDYGLISPYYVTYFFGSPEQAGMQYQSVGGGRLTLGVGRKLLAYLAAFIPGTGQVAFTPLCDTLANAWPLIGVRALAASPTFDHEWGGGSAQAQRIAIKVFSIPAGAATDNGFNLQTFVVGMRAARLPIRGAA